MCSYLTPPYLHVVHTVTGLAAEAKRREQGGAGAPTGATSVGRAARASTAAAAGAPTPTPSRGAAGPPNAAAAAGGGGTSAKRARVSTAAAAGSAAAVDIVKAAKRRESLWPHVKATGLFEEGNAEHEAFFLEMCTKPWGAGSASAQSHFTEEGLGKGDGGVNVDVLDQFPPWKIAMINVLAARSKTPQTTWPQIWKARDRIKSAGRGGEVQGVAAAAGSARAAAAGSARAAAPERAAAAASTPAAGRPQQRAGRILPASGLSLNAAGPHRPHDDGFDEADMRAATKESRKDAEKRKRCDTPSDTGAGPSRVQADTGIGREGVARVRGGDRHGTGMQSVPPVDAPPSPLQPPGANMLEVIQTIQRDAGGERDKLWEELKRSEAARNVLLAEKLEHVAEIARLGAELGHAQRLAAPFPYPWVQPPHTVGAFGAPPALGLLAPGLLVPEDLRQHVAPGILADGGALGGGAAGAAGDPPAEEGGAEGGAAGDALAQAGVARGGAAGDAPAPAGGAEGGAAGNALAQAGVARGGAAGDAPAPEGGAAGVAAGDAPAEEDGAEGGAAEDALAQAGVARGGAAGDAPAPEGGARGVAAGDAPAPAGGAEGGANGGDARASGRRGGARRGRAASGGDAAVTNAAEERQRARTARAHAAGAPSGSQEADEVEPAGAGAAEGSEGSGHAVAERRSSERRALKASKMNAGPGSG